MQEREPVFRSANDLKGYSVIAKDGEIGSVDDIYFDDERWTARYLVINTGNWLSSRCVLISPIAFETADWDNKKIYLSLTKQQIEESPSIAKDEPVSRQFEMQYHTYYGWPAYWQGTGLWGYSYYPQPMAPAIYRPVAETGVKESPVSSEEKDRHLRSTNEVTGYTIMGVDDSIGNVDDFIINDLSWEIRWMVVDTTPWWFGGKVLLLPGSINRIEWANRTVYAGLTRNQIKNSPEWKTDKPIDMEYDKQLYEYYMGKSKAA